MATLEEIVIQLTAETAQLRAEMQTATKAVTGATEKMDKAIQEFSDNSKKNTNFFTTAFATMSGFLGSQAVLGVLGAVKDGVGLVVDQLIEGGQEAIKDEQAFARLSQSLANTGKFSADAAKELQKYANDMEGLAGVGSDVIANNLALLSSLTKLNSQGLQGAQTAAIELSAALGKDLATTTEMVAKAINGNDMAFKKLGINMQLTSDTAANLNAVMATVTDRFGGAAASKLNTFAGALFMIKDAWGDMFKEVAKAVTQNDVVIATMGSISEIFSSFTEQLKGGGPAIRNGIGAALIELIDIIQGLISGFSTFFKYMNAGLQAVATGVSVLVNGFMALGHALNGDLDKAGKSFDNIIESAMSTNKAFENISKDNFLDATAAKLGEIKAVASTAFEEMKTKPIEASRSQDQLKNKIQEVSALTKEESEILKSYAEGLAGQSSAIGSQYAFRVSMLQTTLEQTKAAEDLSMQDQMAAQQKFFEDMQAIKSEQFAYENEQLDIARANGLITEEKYQAARLALAQNFAVENTKQQAQITQFNTDQNKKRQENFSSTMNTIATLSSSGNKELAAIGKAAAITQATIDGYAAVQKALASAPPPFNFALAAAVGIATAANVAKIAGVGLKSGITEVPMSAGGGNNGDNFPAILQSGERVVDSQTNQDLKQFLANANGQGSGAPVFNITFNSTFPISRDGIGEVIDALNDALASGAALRILKT